MSFSVYSIAEETQLLEFIFPQVMQRRGGITNHHSLAFSLSTVSAKNYQNTLMCVGVIVCYMYVIQLSRVV